MLVAAPFVGEGGWPGDEFELSGDLGAHLPQGIPVYVFHGLDDETAPPCMPTSTPMRSRRLRCTGCPDAIIS